MSTADKDMSVYLDFWYHSHDGLKLYAREYSHDVPVATIICVPGLTRNSADFAEFCEQLNRDYRVFAVDLRGRGKSDYDPCPQNYHPGTYAQDIQTLISALDLDKLVLIGTSLGGLVSMMVSAMNPDRVKALVVNDIGPEINPSGLERIKSYVRSRPEPIGNWQQALERTRQTLHREYPKFADKDWQIFAKRLYRQQSGVIRLDYDPAISVLFEDKPQAADTPDMWLMFGMLSAIPMMAIRGELSDILLQDTANKMQRLHPRLNLLEVPDVGHAPLFEDPEVAEPVMTFLAQS